MSNLLNRMKRLEAYFDKKRPGGKVRWFLQLPGQSRAEAMAEAGLDRDTPVDDLNICLVKFVSPQDPKCPLQKKLFEAKSDKLDVIDAEIEQLKKELISDGLTGLQLAEIEASSKSRVPNAKRDSQPLKIEPMVSDLGGMFNRR